MATKIPASVASADVEGDNLGTEHILIEKHAWQQDRAMQFNLTADILRYTTVGANPATRNKGTQTLVANLAALPCSVDDYTKNFERKYGGVAVEGDKLFTFYEVEVVSSDRIEFDGSIWFPVNIWFQAESGRCEVQARIGGED